MLTCWKKGFGKRTPVSDYPDQHRGGQGVFTINMTAKKGLIVDTKIVNEDDEVMIMSEEGVVVRTAVSGISQQGRSTQGVRIMNVADKDRVSAVAVTKKGKKTRAKKAHDEMSDIDVDDLDDDIDVEEGASPEQGE